MNFTHFLIPLLLLACCQFAYPTRKCEFCHMELKGLDSDTFVPKDPIVKQYKIWFSLIGHGINGLVYHLFPKDLVDFDGNPIEHCVAMKRAFYGKSFDREVGILKEFAKLDDEHHRHFVKLYQAGHVRYGLWEAYIMELGEISLRDHFKIMRLTDDGIKKVTTDIAFAVKDLHRVAMHLDLKPENMMYFRGSNRELILKAIDFGTSIILNPNDGPENRANSSKEDVIPPIATKHYSAPELEHGIKAVVTPKADIWSIGIMIYEAILLNAHTDLEFFYELMGEKLHATQMIGELNNLYKFNKADWIKERIRAIRQEIERQKKRDQLKNGGQNRVYPSDEQIKQKSGRDYAAYVYLVLKVHLQHPFLYELINSCLEFVPEDRPSANGILSYLDEKCRFESIKENPKPIELDYQTFGIMTMTLSKMKQDDKVLELNDHIKKHFPNLKDQSYNLRNMDKDVDGESTVDGKKQKPCDKQTSGLPEYKNNDIETKIVVKKVAPKQTGIGKRLHKGAKSSKKRGTTVKQ